MPDWYNDDLNPVPVPVPEQNDRIPEGLSESNRDEQSVNEPSKDWGKAKGALTRVSNQTGGSSSKKAANKYIGSLGGSRSAAKAAAQGVRTAVRYVGLLGSLASNGINGTLTNLGLGDFVGKSSEEICAAIANAIAPIGATNDEAIARDALLATMDALYTKLLDAGGSLETLDRLTPELVKETLIEYVSNFVFCKWMYELGSAIEKGSISENEAIGLEREVKDLIIEETVQSYRDISLDLLNLNDNNITRVITEIFETAYSILAI